MQTIGSRAQVWHGTSKKTSGGLTKSDLMKNKAGRIVSRSKHNSAKRERRLEKYGYKTRKGVFGHIKMESRGRRSRGRRSRSRRHRGGSALTPSSVHDSYMIKDLVPQEFDPLDRALVGGRRRRHRRGSRRSRRSRSRSRSRSRRYRGGTTKPFADISTASPLNRALIA